MKLHSYAAALALAVIFPLSSCSLFGVSAEDSEEARAKAERVVAIVQLGVEAGTIFANKFLDRCEAEPTAKLCEDVEFNAALALGRDALSARLADLRALVDAGSTDAEQLAGAIDLALASLDDVTRIIAAYNGANEA